MKALVPSLRFHFTRFPSWMSMNRPSLSSRGFTLLIVDSSASELAVIKKNKKTIYVPHFGQGTKVHS